MSKLMLALSRSWHSIDSKVGNLDWAVIHMIHMETDDFESLSVPHALERAGRVYQLKLSTLSKVTLSPPAKSIDPEVSEKTASLGSSSLHT